MTLSRDAFRKEASPFFCLDLHFSFLLLNTHQRVKNIRSTLSREDLIELEGNVTRVLGAGIMEIHCNKDLTVRGRLSGRMKKHRIKVIVGDRVRVSVSPYDPSHGLITYRIKR